LAGELNGIETEPCWGNFYKVSPVVLRGEKTKEGTKGEGGHSGSPRDAIVLLKRMGSA